MMKITLETLQHLSDLSTPHMKAMNDAVTAAYPLVPDEMYTAAMAFQLAILLNALNPSVRPDAVKLINGILSGSNIDYRLQPVDQPTTH